MTRLVLTIPEDKRREIKSWAAAEGLSAARALMMGFSLLKNGADGFAELMQQEHDLDEKERAWAEKIIKGVDDAS